MTARSGSVLLVDYDQERADKFARELERAGYRVETLTAASANVEELTAAGSSVQRSTDEKLDVVLCEVNLPGVSWDEVMTKLREVDIQVPAIMLSDGSDVDEVVTALRLGASDFYIRPIDDWEALYNSIDRCVSQRSLRRDNISYRRQLENANTELRAHVQVLEQDQQAGRHVQMRMLPQSPAAIGDYLFSHTVIPSLYLSGDFTDYFTVGERHASFFIADVSGHGSSSAFVTVLLKNLFARKRSDFLHRGDNTITSPMAMLESANKELLDTGTGKFATMCVGLIDLLDNTLSYAVGGHLPLPVLVGAQGAQYLNGEGTAVGIMEDADYEEYQLQLPEQFMLALFSDGILEILPPDNLVDKEKYFLGVFDGGLKTPQEIVLKLGLDQLNSAPDDIAALFVIRGGKHE